MKRIGRRGTILGLVAACALQLIQPSVSGQREAAKQGLLEQSTLDPKVREILRRSCADCHSNNARLPWYARVSPVSWLIVRHINQGRRKLNFSEWPRNATDEKQNIADSVDKGEMPIRSYLLIHQEAKLSAADRKTIDQWADAQ